MLKPKLQSFGHLMRRADLYPCLFPEHPTQEKGVGQEPPLGSHDPPWRTWHLTPLRGPQDPQKAQPRLPPHNELALISGFQNWASLPFRAVSLNNLLPTWTPKLGTWYDL